VYRGVNPQADLGATRDAIKEHVERLIDDLLKKQRSQIE
jgi:hypothetical protein